MPLEQSPNFSISIVSHGHRTLIASLLDDLARINRPDVEVILTWNLEKEAQGIDVEKLPFPVKMIVNPMPKGFAANHNAAFQNSRGAHFVLLNPDIRLPEDPFDALVDVLRMTPDAICAPLIVNTMHEREDSARFFPSPWILFKKAIAKVCGISLAQQPIPSNENLLLPDWVAGMFVVIPRAIYSNLGGLSERYFLYYEDVDLCARAKLSGIRIVVTSTAFAIHDARRESHRKLRFLTWHMASALKFFLSKAYLTLKWQALRKTRSF